MNAGIAGSGGLLQGLTTAGSSGVGGGGGGGGGSSVTTISLVPRKRKIDEGETTLEQLDGSSGGDGGSSTSSLPSVQAKISRAASDLASSQPIFSRLSTGRNYRLCFSYVFLCLSKV